GMVSGFASMIRSLHTEQSKLSLAIVVSEESKDYRPEMLWLAVRLREAGVPAQTVSPDDVIFTVEGLFLAGPIPITALYRFFELFDVKTLPKDCVIMYAAKKGRLA